MVGRNISVSLSAPASHYNSSHCVRLQSGEGPLDLLAYREVSRVILDLVTIWLELKMVTLIEGGLEGLTGWGKALVWVLMKSEGF